MTDLDDVVIHEPFKVQVTRWRCPFCGRSHSARTRCVEHMGRCWQNPANRSCKTCAFFSFDYDEPEVGYRGAGEECGKGLSPQVPSEDRPDRLTFPLHCPSWELSPEAVES